MKKLLLLLLIVTSAVSAQLNTKITNTSFTAVDSICPGTAQYIDFIVTGGSYTTSTHLKVYIKHNSTNTLLLDSLYYPFYQQQNVSGDTARVDFPLPSSYPAGPFTININLAPSTTTGLMCTPSLSGIVEHSKGEKKLIGMYDIYGKETTTKDGFIILLYSNGIREKIYYFDYLK